MKRILAMLFTLVILLSMLPASALGAENDAVSGEKGPAKNSAYRVAMITDFGKITDQSYNQATYDAVSSWCASHTVDYTYYQPSEDSTQARIDAIEQAIADGYNTIVAAGWLFGAAIPACAKAHEDVYFLALDVYRSDLIDGTDFDNEREIVIPTNVALIRYKEEIAGYLAGYAAVKLGYRHLAFLGGMAVPAVLRYGYGFVQGVDTAAIELNVADQVVVEYVYANQFYGDSDITAYMDALYQNRGVEVTFACGGGVFTSVAEAASEVKNAKVIGVDIDQAPYINGTYNEGLTLTSAEKKLGNTVKYMLEELIVNGNWSSYGGKENNFGLVSAEKLSKNYVGLPDSTLWNNTFTQADYTQLIAKIIDRTYVISDNTEQMPQTSCTVNDRGAIKDGSVLQQPVFSDISDKAWYAGAVDYAVQHKLMNGMGNNRFEPESSMTRAMLVTVLWRYEGSPKEGKNSFTDVKDGAWYAKSVAWASEKGVVNGVGGGKFEPDGNITREQMATVLFRYAEKKGMDVSRRGEFAKFADKEKVSSYAKEALQWAVAEGIIAGSSDGGKLYLNPQGKATRAEVATLLMRFFEKAA